MKEQMQWHPGAHERWARETLVFWRLGFQPTYRRPEVIKSLELVCERHGIRGRVIYEVFGQHDLLARFWLPPSPHHQDAIRTVDRDLKRTLAAFHLEYLDMFTVDEIRRHWFWNDPPPADGLTHTPGDADFDAQPPVHILREVSALMDGFNAGLIDRSAVERSEAARTYLSEGVIGIRRVVPGIKFAIVVSTPGDPSRYSAMDALGDRLQTMLEVPSPIIERSLYGGTGFGRFLILGKVRPENFFAINDELISPIVNETGLSGVYGTRSITYIANSRELLQFSEALALPPSLDEELQIDELLDGGENERVEFKGSIFKNINRYGKQRVLEDDPRITEAFARAIVAMLNGNGGVIISGLLERGVRDYEEAFPDEPRRGDLIILGAEFDWINWKRQDVDELENRIRQKLESLIAPSAVDLLRFRRHHVSGRVLFSIDVAAQASEWFYLQSGGRYDFVVRRGSSTATLSGPEIDTYKRLHPRGVDEPGYRTGAGRRTYPGNEDSA